MIAKITRPRTPKVLFRDRLFSMLDGGRDASVTWVSGPAGSGKTTLVASWLDARKLPSIWYQLDEGDGDIATFFYYMGLAARKASPQHKKPLPLLTPEYLFGVSTFTKRYFEGLCLRLKPPFVLVLDNYQSVPDVSPFHEVIRDALSVIPEGIAAIIISRSPSPPALAPLAAYKKINYVGPQDLRFDISETRLLIDPGRMKSEVGSVAERLQSITEGWAAGLVLLMERVRSSGLGPEKQNWLAPEELFDYFASEIFAKTDTATQDFLLKTSFLPGISVSAARELTHNNNSGTVLSSLSRSNFFTERRSLADPVYQYHPLFRGFLQARAKERFSSKELLDVLRRAALLLEQEGHVEDSAELLRMSEDWEGLVRLILANVRELSSQGRSKPVEGWIKGLPRNILEGDPWLLYWLGACRMPFDLKEGKRCFEEALALFRKQNEPAGVYLAWSGAVEAVYQEMGDVKQLVAMLGLFDELVKEHGQPPPEVGPQVAIRIFAALPWRNDDQTFILWKKKILDLMDSNLDAGLRMLAGFYLCLYHIWWIGEYATGQQMLDVMRSIAHSAKTLPPLARNMHKSAGALFDLLMASHGQCLKTVGEGLAISKESGVHIWDNIFLMTGAGSCLCARDTAGAGEFLERMAPSLDSARLFDMFYFHQKSAWRFMLLNNMRQAVIHETKALDLASKTGFEIAEAQAHFLMSSLMRSEGEENKAEEHMTKCRSIGRRMGSSIVEYMSLLLASTLAFDKQDDETGLACLKDAMTLGRTNGYIYFCGWHESLLTPLCIKALEARIEPEYVAHLIKKCRLLPEGPQLHLECWPWDVKVYTLGRFEIIIDGKPLRFSGKVQKKPLEMLKVLVASGGQNVSEQRVMDILWPDADGDTAFTTFKSTLHRLRKLLGEEELIKLQDGRMSLNQQSCWVDALAFELKVGLAESMMHDSKLSSKDDEHRLLLEAALNIYQGHFLSEEDNNQWAGAFKEKLQRRHQIAANKLGEYWLGQADKKSGPKDGKEQAVKKAVKCYQRAIEIDELAEEFYQNLIICHQRLGNNAEAAKVYRRCCEALSQGLGIEPSEKTRVLINKTK